MTAGRLDTRRSVSALQAHFLRPIMLTRVCACRDFRKIAGHLDNVHSVPALQAYFRKHKKRLDLQRLVQAHRDMLEQAREAEMLAEQQVLPSRLTGSAGCRNLHPLQFALNGSAHTDTWHGANFSNDDLSVQLRIFQLVPLQTAIARMTCCRIAGPD